jgi:TRAP-type C4-dicarboxylate transport system permease small subunit
VRPFSPRVAQAVAALAIAAGWALLGLACLVAVETIGRKFFAFSLQGADEIGGYVLAFGSAVGFCYALVHRAHIRIDLLLPRLPRAAQASLNILAFALLTAFAGLLAWRATAVAAESWALRARAPTPLGTLLILPQGIWAFALAAFALLCTVALVRGIVGLAARRTAEVARDLGPTSIQEELEAELADARRRGVPTRAAS